MSLDLKKLDECFDNPDNVADAKKWFDNPDNVADAKKWFYELADKEKEFENKVIELHSEISEPEAFEAHIQLVLKEMQDKIDYCNKHHNGYELIDGELCFMNGTENFSVLFGYFKKYGKIGKRDEDFLGAKYHLNGYTMKIYHGQGSFRRLCKGRKILIQEG